MHITVHCFAKRGGITLVLAQLQSQTPGLSTIQPSVRFAGRGDDHACGHS
jgi:hypothetical protein